MGDKLFTLLLILGGMELAAAAGTKVQLHANRDILQSSLESRKAEQVHISFGDTATSMNIMWATRGNDLSFVEYHTGDRQLSKTVEGTTMKLYTTNEEGLKYMHRVSISELTPETKYFYHVRGEDKETLSSQYSFIVPPHKAGAAHTFMVYGDLGLETKHFEFLLQEAVNEKYEAIFHVGDIAYDLNGGNGQVGDKFLRQIERVASRIPYMTVPGDHERYDEFLHYRYRFSMPQLPWPMPSDNLWYSIDIGPIHFVIYSTEVFFYDVSSVQPMLLWLKEDLEKANKQRSAKPWIIAMGHKPMYCSVDDPREDCTKDKSVVRTSLERLFYSQGVDLIINGHQHYYERTWPVLEKRALQYTYREPSAPVHITIGTLGSAYHSEKSSNKGGQWSAFTLSEKGKESFGRLKIFNATHLFWEVRESANSKLVDQMWIIQPFHRQFIQQKPVYLPNPLGEAGEQWLRSVTEAPFGLESFLGISGRHYGDDYETKFTVLLFVFIFCVVGLIARKKVLNFVRICCFRQEPCKKLNATITGATNTV